MQQHQHQQQEWGGGGSGNGGGNGALPPPLLPPPSVLSPPVASAATTITAAAAAAKGPHPQEFPAAQRAGLSRAVAEVGSSSRCWWYLDPGGSPRGPFSLAQLRGWARGLRRDANAGQEYRDFVTRCTCWRDGSPFRVHVSTLLAVHRTRSPSPQA